MTRESHEQPPSFNFRAKEECSLTAKFRIKEIVLQLKCKNSNYSGQAMSYFNWKKILKHVLQVQNFV